MREDNVDDRDLGAARAELMVLKIVIDRALAGLGDVDGEMLVTAPPVVRETNAAQRSAPSSRPANPTLDTVVDPARSGLSESLTALRHIARGAAKHLDHHTEKLRQHTVAWYGTYEETES